MIGLSEAEVRRIVGEQLSYGQPRDDSTKVDRLIDGIAQVIAANNRAIENRVSQMIEERLRVLGGDETKAPEIT